MNESLYSASMSVHKITGKHVSNRPRWFDLVKIVTGKDFVLPPDKGPGHPEVWKECREIVIDWLKKNKPPPLTPAEREEKRLEAIEAMTGKRPFKRTYATSNGSFYESDEWRELRYQAIKENGARCQCCGRSPQNHGIVLHVDHIKPRSKFPELELSASNLQILCEDCNIGKKNHDTIDWRGDNPFILKGVS